MRQVSWIRQGYTLFQKQASVSLAFDIDPTVLFRFLNEHDWSDLVSDCACARPGACGLEGGHNCRPNLKLGSEVADFVDRFQNLVKNFCNAKFQTQISLGENVFFGVQLKIRFIHAVRASVQCLNNTGLPSDVVTQPRPLFAACLEWGHKLLASEKALPVTITAKASVRCGASLHRQVLLFVPLHCLRQWSAMILFTGFLSCACRAGCLVLFFSNELLQEQTSQEPQALLPQVSKSIREVERYKETLIRVSTFVLTRKLRNHWLRLSLQSLLVSVLLSVQASYRGGVGVGVKSRSQVSNSKFDADLRPVDKEGLPPWVSLTAKFGTQNLMMILCGTTTPLQPNKSFGQITRTKILKFPVSQSLAVCETARAFLA